MSSKGKSQSGAIKIGASTEQVEGSHRRITPLTPPMLEVVTALAAEEAHSESTHSQAASSLGHHALGKLGGSRSKLFLKLNRLSSSRPNSRKCSKWYSQWSIITLFGLQVKSIRKEKRSKRDRQKVSSVKLVWRNKGTEGTLSEEHYVQDDYTSDPFFDDIVDKDAAVTPDIERKSDETEEINVEEKEASNVKSGDTEELDLETFQSTARQSTITPRTLNFEDEAGPSSPIRPTQNIEPEEQFEVDNRSCGYLLTKRLWRTTMLIEVARKFKLNGCRRGKAKDTRIAQTQFPQMKELLTSSYDYIKELLQRCIPMGSEKEWAVA
ncbi:hypothetical protein Tco_1165204 [Tanacetum coccineum]